MSCFLAQASTPARTCTDGQLVALFRDGEQRAFEQLHARHGRALHAYVRRLMADGPDVDDVVQDVFMRAVAEFHRDRGAFDALRPWLYRVARNRVIDHVRASRPTAELRHEPAAGDDTADAIDVQTQLRDTMSALRALPSRQRRALVLHAVHGEPYSNVARVLDVTPHAARTLAYRGRESTRAAMSTTAA